MNSSSSEAAQTASPARFPRTLVLGSSACFVLFWLGVIAGKLRIAFGLDLPAIPELALLLLLELAVILGLAACLRAERLRDQASRPTL
jgi:hypothetical protein